MLRIPRQFLKTATASGVRFSIFHRVIGDIGFAHMPCASCSDLTDAILAMASAMSLLGTSPLLCAHCAAKTGTDVNSFGSWSGICGQVV